MRSTARLALFVLSLITLSPACGDNTPPGPDAGLEQRSAAYTTATYTSGSTTWTFYRPNTWPNGTDCPIRYYAAAGDPIWLQDWCPSTGQLTGRVMICSWVRGDHTGYHAPQNAWCGTLARGNGIPDLGWDQYQDPSRGWPWQLSFLQMDSDPRGVGVQQVALCTDANYSGLCHFFGRDGEPALRGYLQGDIRRFTQDAAGNPFPHMSIFVQ